MNIILIIIIFGIIVFFHEFGHFIVAKINKITVMEFSVGMGPALFSKQKNGTKYSLRLLPLGGYCLMMGEDEDVDDENSFSNKPLWVRAMVVAAGPIFNFILAFVFSIALVHFAGCDPCKLANVMEGSAAYEAGIEKGDTVTAIDGDRVYNYRELLLFMSMKTDASPIELDMIRENGEKYTTVVTPKKNEAGEYKIGVEGGYMESPNLMSDIKYAGLELRYWVKATVTSLKWIVTGKVKSDQIMGPVGVGGAFNDVIEEVKEESDTFGETVANILLNMVNWCILLSVNLGVMNLLPIPALDGGRLLFLLVEAIRRKKIPQEKEAIVNMIGFALLIILMVVVFFNDIKNVFFS